MSSSSSKPMDAYLGTNAMRATQSSMSLVSSILGFEIVELWTQEAGEKLHCTYVHAAGDLLKKYPDLIHGHYPNHKKEHKLSPMLCNLARSSSDRYHWRVVEESAAPGIRPRKDSSGQQVANHDDHPAIDHCSASSHPTPPSRLPPPLCSARRLSSTSCQRSTRTLRSQRRQRWPLCSQRLAS